MTRRNIYILFISCFFGIGAFVLMVLNWPYHSEDRLMTISMSFNEPDGTITHIVCTANRTECIDRNINEERLKELVLEYLNSVRTGVGLAIKSVVTPEEEMTAITDKMKERRRGMKGDPPYDILDIEVEVRKDIEHSPISIERRLIHIELPRLNSVRKQQ